MAFPLNQNVSFGGQKNNAGNDRELLQELYSGEVIRAFRSRNIMSDKVKVKTLRGGKSYSFPLIGKANAKYHTAGQLIEADQIANSKRLVTIDGLMISPSFIDELDEHLTHYDIRSPYSQESGWQLSSILDRNLLRIGCKAAAIDTTAKAESAGLNPVTDEVFTSNITLKDKDGADATADGDITGASIYQGILSALEEFTIKGIDVNGANIFLYPTEFYKMFNAPNVQEMVWVNRDVGNSDMNDVTKAVARIAGIPVYLTNHLPRTNQSAGLGDDPEWTTRQAAYRGDFSKVRGLIMKPEAVALVKAKDVTTDIKYQMERQGTLIVAKQAVGANILEAGKAITLNVGTAEALSEPQKTARTRKKAE